MDKLRFDMLVLIIRNQYYGEEFFMHPRREKFKKIVCYLEKTKNKSSKEMVENNLRFSAVFSTNSGHLH